jgi:excisionase family DNA binding protein
MMLTVVVGSWRIPRRRDSDSDSWAVRLSGSVASEFKNAWNGDPMSSVAVAARLRTRDAARYLGISHTTLETRRWRERHGIPTLKVGRAVVFDVGALDAWLERAAERADA